MQYHFGNKRIERFSSSNDSVGLFIDSTLRLESTHGALFSSHGNTQPIPQMHSFFTVDTVKFHTASHTADTKRKRVTLRSRANPLPRNSTGPSTCSLLLFLFRVTLSASLFFFQFFSPFLSWQPFHHPQLLIQRVSPKPPPQPHSMWGLCFPLKSINNRPQI
jgi:hypothetical protein